MTVVRIKDEMDVNVQDQVTKSLSLRMSRILATLTLAVDAIVGSRTVTMTAGHGLTAGDRIIMIETLDYCPSLFYASVISVATNVITLDTLVTNAFTTSAIVYQYDPELNLDGSTTPIVVSLENPFECAVDITRFIFHITDGTAMDDGTFGGLSALTYGVAMRKYTSAKENEHLWNVKTNGEISEMCFDTRYDEKAPAGVYGFTARLTYAGQSKHGVAIRLQPGEAIQMIIQDDLTGLTSFRCKVQGHITDN